MSESLHGSSNTLLSTDSWFLKRLQFPITFDYKDSYIIPESMMLSLT